MSTLYQYAIGSGWNLPSGSLTNMELLTGVELPPRTAPVNPFPITNPVLSGSSQSQGRIDHVWEFSYMSYDALDTFIDTFLVSSGTLYENRQVTINTRRRDRGNTTYARYNAYVHYPKAQDDYDIPASGGDKVENLRIRFTDLQELS